LRIETPCRKLWGVFSICRGEFDPFSHLGAEGCSEVFVLQEALTQKSRGHGSHGKLRHVFELLKMQTLVALQPAGTIK
jgi:hypothetical protein